MIESLKPNGPAAKAIARMQLSQVEDDCCEDKPGLIKLGKYVDKEDGACYCLWQSESPPGVLIEECGG